VGAVNDKEKHYTCNICGVQTFNKNALDKHITALHGVATKLFKCEQCYLSSVTKFCFALHFKAVHDKVKDNKCPQCDFALSTPSSLKFHNKTVHV
jgi:rubrerythrin